MAKPSSKPEHNLVRLPFIRELVKAGWDLTQIQFSPEWLVPKNPSSASRREAGQSFEGFPVDIAVFAKPEYLGDFHHLSILVETKAPDLQEGRNQLEIYLSLEPHVRLGIWTNGTKKLLLYRAADGSFIEDKTGRLPKSTDSLLAPAKKPLKYADLEIPKVSELRSTFQRLLDIIVTRDTKSTRSDDQLNQVCNLILVKLESDKMASNDPTMDLVFSTGKMITPLPNEFRISSTR